MGQLFARQRAITAFCAAGMAVLNANGALADVTISSGVTQNMSCSAGTCAPTTTKAVLNASDLQNLLASGSVIVTTTGSGVQASNIKVTAPISWSNSSGLKLDAFKSITVARTIAVTGSGGLTLDTDDGGKGGALSFGAKGNVTFQNLSSGLTINGVAYILVNSLAGLESDIASNQDQNIALAGNYDASGDGTYSQSPVATIYDGHFEGLGNTVSNLSINDRNPGDYAGLFYEIYPSGWVSDLYVSNVNISSANDSAAGAIVGDNQGTIANSHSSGIVNSAGLEAGGIAGYCAGSIVNSSSDASVTGNSAGGLVGQSQGTISDSHASGTVQAISGPNGPTGGGLVGENQGSVETSWASGSVTSAVDSSTLGGLIGEMDGVAVRDSYATGAVPGTTNSLIGGLVGSAFVTITSSYSTGAPSGSGGLIGGFVGYDGSTGMKQAYWDMTTSGITDPSKGAGNIVNDPGIKGLSTKKLQARLPKGFSTKIWSQDTKVNGGLPYLRANPPTK